LGFLALVFEIPESEDIFSDGLLQVSIVLA